VLLRFASTRVAVEFKLSDIIGEPEKTCHAFNYGMSLARDYAVGNLTADICSAIQSENLWTENFANWSNQFVYKLGLFQNLLNEL